MGGKVIFTCGQWLGKTGMKLVKKKSKPVSKIPVTFLHCSRNILGKEEPQALVWNYKVKIPGLPNSLVPEVLYGMESLIN